MVFLFKCLKSNRNLFLINKFKNFSNYAWEIEKYQLNQNFNSDCLKFNNKKELPAIESPNELLITVKATSINPIDLLLIQGYGKVLIDTANVFLESCKSKISYDKFPLILGRDFSGIVESVGANVKEYKKGDEVWGCLSPFKQGTHCKYIISTTNDLSLKPKNLSFEEAASLPYVALTCWSSIYSKNFSFSQQKLTDKRVLILGASGGIGTFSVQLFKSLNCFVSATCSVNSFDFVKNICKIDELYDYNNLDNFFEEKQKFYDYVFDYSSKSNFVNRQNYFKLLKNNFDSYYITTSPPLLDNLDKHGLFCGAFKSSLDILNDKFFGKNSFKNVKWAFYSSNSNALKQIKILCENKKIIPTIYKIFKKDELRLAYETMYNGNLRGKIIINFD